MVNGHGVYSIVVCLLKGGRSRRWVTVENRTRRVKGARVSMAFCALKGEDGQWVLRDGDRCVVKFESHNP